MEPSQSINLIILSLIVVMHAGVLALRLGISLGKTWKTNFDSKKINVINKKDFKLLSF